MVRIGVHSVANSKSVRLICCCCEVQTPLKLPIAPPPNYPSRPPILCCDLPGHLTRTLASQASCPHASRPTCCCKYVLILPLREAPRRLHSCRGMASRWLKVGLPAQRRISILSLPAAPSLLLVWDESGIMPNYDGHSKRRAAPECPQGPTVHLSPTSAPASKLPKVDAQ